MSEALARWLQFLNGDGMAFVVAVVVAALVAFLAAWPAGLLALRWSAIDVPGGRRIHLRPTARLGGLAILAALWVALPLGLWVLASSRPEAVEQLPALGATLAVATLVCAIGARDDLAHLPAGKKLAAVALAAVLLALLGVRLDFVEVPFVGKVALGPLAIPATVLWVVACTNALNLIDGVDGLGSGVTLVSALALALVAFGVGDPAAALGFGAVAGACGGFLVHNRAPARIFLGDSGALLLGFMLAALSAAGCTKRATAVLLSAGLCALAIPLLDLTQAFARRFRRALRGFGPASILAAIKATGVADKEHIHHRLLVRGLTHRQVARAISLVAAVPSLLGLLLLPSIETGWATLCGGRARRGLRAAAPRVAASHARRTGGAAAGAGLRPAAREPNRTAAVAEPRVEERV
jgi:UDP-GlcNAc:undecaprenyl-phosphate GlcNAc-1-phosphate transferase